MTFSTANMAKTSKLSAMELKKNENKKVLIVHVNREKSLEIFFLSIWNIICKECKNTKPDNTTNAKLHPSKEQFLKIHQLHAITLSLEIVYSFIFNEIKNLSSNINISWENNDS